MKKGRLILGMMIGLVSSIGFAQELLPDQNPNYQKSAEKYAERSVELTANQSQTIQDTYKAYDWREAKQEAKDLRLERKYELKKLRYETRGRYDGCYGNYYGPSYNNYGNRYYNGYRNYGYNYPHYNNINPLLGLGAGLGLYYLLR
ncbi:hypothetical protein [Crocinitomix catalasitica]|uniref:hypothetical protein n=1 Tax=Crocinitomix catalasitica TaxID=184607 RepID=UPI0006862A1B|nr:hypothetical protein [Crocinitomix catalasitica]